MGEIKIENLTKSYGKSRGIQDVNLEINEGEIFGFIGPNGAGKSTTIRCIMDLINKNYGKIFVKDTEILRTKFQIKEQIGYLPSEIYLYEDLTVEKMFKYSESFYKKDCTQKIKYLVEKLDIDLKKKINELSLGNLKKVGIVLALMHDPKILILDEATSGLDPLKQEAFYEIILDEKKKGKTIFFSSHALNEVRKICDRVCIIKEGKIIKIDKTEKFIDSSFSIVTVHADNLKQIQKDINANILEQTDDHIKFIFGKSSNELIKTLSKFDIQKVTIEEPSMEEVFMHYYN